MSSIPSTSLHQRPNTLVLPYSAVMSIAFHHPHVVVDGNVKRVLARLYEIDDPVNRSSSQKIFHQAVSKLFDTGNPSAFNQAMMELGALICLPSEKSRMQPLSSPKTLLCIQKWNYGLFISINV